MRAFGLAISLISFILFACSDATPPLSKNPTPPERNSPAPAPAPAPAQPPHNGPIPRAVSGYAAFDPSTVKVEKLSNPYFPGTSIDIYIPSDISSPRPVLFFAPGWGDTKSTSYEMLLRFVAAKGTIAIYAPHSIDSYNTDDLYNAFIYAVSYSNDTIDTSRIAFAGHSYGGGAIFHLLQKVVSEKGWGSNGKFLYAMAPWIAFDMQPSDLADFPANTRLIISQFEEDFSTDPRIPISLFVHLPIPERYKRYLTARSATIDGYHYYANHGTPASSKTSYDALDDYAIFLPLGMVMDAVFKENTEAENQLFGISDTLSTHPLLPAQLSTSHPVALLPPERYDYVCDDPRNPLRELCGE